MLRRAHVVLILGISVLILCVARVGAVGQGASQDVLGSLLAEVRGLRQAIEQMASASARVQLGLGRLQLQEQRLNTMLRRQEALRDQMAEVSRRDRELREQIATLEEAARTSATVSERKSSELDLQMVRKDVQKLAY